MKLAVTGPLPVPVRAFAPAATDVARPATARWEPATEPAPAPRVDETIRGGLTWAAISAMISLPGRI